MRYLGLMRSYRGREGSWAWMFHRISGIAVWAFVVLHIIDIYLAGGDPRAYDELLAFYASPIGRVMEILLGAALLYHALNGMRIIVMDFWPSTTRFHKQMWYANWILFAVIGLPILVQIMAPAFGLAAPFTFGGQ